MADNEQNTYAGGAGALTAPTGNSIFDSFLRLANVAAVGLGTYEDIQDRRAAREIQIANETRPPQQAMPASQSNSPADYLSNSASIQSVIFYGVALSVIGFGSFWALKKL